MPRRPISFGSLKPQGPPQTMMTEVVLTIATDHCGTPGPSRRSRRAKSLPPLLMLTARPSSRVDGIRRLALASSSASLSMIASNVRRVAATSDDLMFLIAISLTSCASGTSFAFNPPPVRREKYEYFLLVAGEFAAGHVAEPFHRL